MARALLFLMFAYAVVPPGFCLCRLSAAVLAECPEHEGHECDCPQIQQDGLHSSGWQCPVSGDLDHALLTLVENLPAATEPAKHSLPPLCDLHEPPLYLTLRALLL